MVDGWQGVPSPVSNEGWVSGLDVDGLRYSAFEPPLLCGQDANLVIINGFLMGTLSQVLAYRGEVFDMLTKKSQFPQCMLLGTGQQ